MNLLESLPLNRTKLRVLFEIYAGGEDYLRNIEKKTGINPSLLHRILKTLNKAGIIDKKEKGKENYYCLAEENKELLVRILEKFQLDVAGEKKDIKVLLKLLLNNKELLNVCKNIYLFGSAVQGDFTEKSDIDILFVSRKRGKVAQWCREVSMIIGREINPLVYTPEKFKSDLYKKEPLLNSIVKNIKNRVIIK